ncbi:unnamed protein product [Lota lota]
MAIADARVRRAHAERSSAEGIEEQMKPGDGCLGLVPQRPVSLSAVRWLGPVLRANNSEVATLLMTLAVDHQDGGLSEGSGRI